MTKKILTLAILATVFTGSFLLSKNQVLGAVRCETQYGGTEVCVRTGELQINKKVWDTKGEFVDNLTLSSYKFSAGEEITFKLEIKNVGDKTFSKVSVTDSLPSYLELSSGDLSFEITDLAPGESKTREIKARVVSADRLPADKSLICVINAAEAWSGDERDRDTSQVCLEKKVLGIVTIPVTGPENSLLLFSLSLIPALFGLILIKKSFLS